MQSARKKRFDLLVVVLLNIFGFLYAIWARNFYIGRVLFSVAAISLPAIIYMAYRKPKDWRKIILFTLVFGLLFDGLILEFFAEVTKAWNAAVIPSLPYKFLGVVPLDTLIGEAIISPLYGAVFYDHFLNRDRTKKIPRRFLLTVLIGLYAFLALLLTYFLNISFLKSLPYPYFCVGILAVIPTVIMAYTHPEVYKKMVTMSIYAFFLFLSFEIVGVSFKWWVFEGGQYIGWVHLLGIKFPFEEIIFWMIFYPAALIAFYEFSVDDEK